MVLKLLLALFIMSPIKAATLNKHSFACLTDNSLNQLVQSYADNDKNAQNYLLNTAKLCFATPRSYPVTVLTSVSRHSHVRIYVGKNTANVWVISSQIKN